MKQYYAGVFLLFACFFCHAQLYFPPKTDDAWEAIAPAALGWNTTAIPDLIQFLDEKNTKAFIVLKNGKIAIEQYFDTFTKDSVWYWASAGKSLASCLVGIAQQEGLLDIHDKTSDYLGKGWTSAPPEKEDQITIWHQITMTSGLDDGIAPTPTVPDPDNCLEPACLQYLTDAGQRWAYHNAPYRLVQDVVAAASGQSWQQFTNQRIKAKIGMEGGWFNYVYWSRPRDMARFGLLVLNKGAWDGTPILSDTAYYQQMINTSQNLNKSYGYLWWLNGKGSFILPQAQFVFPYDMLPSAPDEVFMALGKDDQKIYIYPSQNIVVIRMGESAEGKLALSAFDDALWAKLMPVFSTTTASTSLQLNSSQVQIYPNPGADKVYFSNIDMGEVKQIDLFNAFGSKIKSWQDDPRQGLQLESLEPGIFFFSIQKQDHTRLTLKWVKN